MPWTILGDSPQKFELCMGGFGGGGGVVVVEGVFKDNHWFNLTKTLIFYVRIINLLLKRACSLFSCDSSL